MPVYNTKYLTLCEYPKDSRSRYLFPGFPGSWCAPGTKLQLEVPGVTGGREVCSNLIPRVTPLNAGELRLQEGTSGTLGRVGGQAFVATSTQNLLI